MSRVNESNLLSPCLTYFDFSILHFNDCSLIFLLEAMSNHEFSIASPARVVLNWTLAVVIAYNYELLVSDWGCSCPMDPLRKCMCWLVLIHTSFAMSPSMLIRCRACSVLL